MADTIPRYLDLILPYDGVGMSADQPRYLDLIADGEKQSVRKALGKESGCALVVRGFWRLFGVSDKRVRPPYVPSRAVAWLVAIGKERGAWVPAHPDKLPGIGDMVLIGGDASRDGGVEHVFTAIRLTPNPLTVHSIDGGQLDEGNKQIIRQKQRKWIVRNRALWDQVIDGTDPGANATFGRRVHGWIDICALMHKEPNLDQES